MQAALLLAPTSTVVGQQSVSVSHPASSSRISDCQIEVMRHTNPLLPVHCNTAKDDHGLRNRQYHRPQAIARYDSRDVAIVVERLGVSWVLLLLWFKGKPAGKLPIVSFGGSARKNDTPIWRCWSG